MSITDRQKNIVNPYAESLDTDSRNGVGYDYNNRRNRFVQDAIQERYLYFFQFPTIGEPLRVKTEDNIENPEIEEADLLAYFALYPQNGKMVLGKPTEISTEEAYVELESVIRQLEENEVIEKYISKTTELSYQEQFQARQNLANLIAIPPAHSNAYQNKLRRAFGLPNYQYSDEANLTSIQLSPRASTYVITDTNVDLYDWRQNCLAGSEDKTYYNSVDRNYYFTRRTDLTAREALEFNFNGLRQIFTREQQVPDSWENMGDRGKNLYNSLVTEGIKQILEATGKFSEDNFSSLKQRYLAPNNFVLYVDYDFRPGSRWTYAVKIRVEDIEALPDPESLSPSKEETEISVLSKAKRLIGEDNKSAISVQFQVENLIRYIFFVRGVLRDYDERLFEVNLNKPELLNGIDLNREADRLNSFFSLLELFYNYNKISLQDTDFVEMFFTEDYQLDHVVVNGSFYYQGTGGKTYLNVEEEGTRVINAFGILTATTFSIISNSHQIYEDMKSASPNNRREVLDFINEYLFPKINLDSITEQQSKVSKIEKQRLARRKRIFETYSRLTRGNPRDFEALWTNRPISYKISSTLNNMDCNTGQVAAMKYALAFWKAGQSKTKLQSIIRQAIILVRNEVIEDEITKKRITQAVAYADNPNTFWRDASRQIDERISCSLDVIGDFIEDQFLDPLQLPPAVNTLTRSAIEGKLPTIEFKKCSMTSSKSRQSVLYQKMLETILMNFIKSIVAGIAKDVIKALLGCGPDNPNGADLKASLRKVDYGYVDLMDLLDGIDIVQIAKFVGLENVVTEEVEGNVVTNRSDADERQLRAFISDVSKMSTPVELQQLINGDASNDLLEHILETVSGDQDIVRSNIDVDIYNELNFSLDRIDNYFIAIGNALDGTLDNLGDMGFVSPLEAYCDRKDGFIDPLALDFSIPDIEAQYNDIVNSKIDKINGLCRFLRDMSSIELEVQRLIDSLPVLQWYNDLLQDIADLSNSYFAYLAEKLASLFGEDQTNRLQPTYNLYNSQMGTQLYYEIFFALREVLINQLYVDSDKVYFQTPAGAAVNRVGFSAAIEENFWGQDTIEVRGNFGARKNEQTDENVYKFIWSDRRGGGATIAPGRLNIPQYRDPPVPPNDFLDAAYYSLRNSPEKLIRKLTFPQNYLSVHNRKRINYGGPRVYEGANIDAILQFLGNLGNDNSEINYLAQMSNKVYEFLKESELKYPYTGFTGATYLKCGNLSEQDIKITYVKDPVGNRDETCVYNPTFDFNEFGAGSVNLLHQQNYDLIDYRIFSGEGLTISGSTIRVDSTDKLIVDNVQLPWLAKDATKRYYSNLSIGINSNLGGITDRRSISSRYKNSLVLQNYSTRIDSLIDNSVINDTGKRRMPKYMAALNKTSLQKTDDICVTAEDVIKAEAAIRKIQANMFSFFVNIMPMASAYPNWKSNGTVQIISDYLFKRLLDDLSDKQILGPFYQLIPFVKLVYPHIEGDDEFEKNPIILDELSPMQNTKNIVKAVYSGMLDNIAQTSEYANVNKSVFDPSDLQRRYKELVFDFYQKLSDSRITPNARLAMFLPEGQDVTDARNLLSSFITEDGDVTDRGMRCSTYYFPVAFQIASYMIYMDRGIRYSNRYVTTNYRMLVEEAATDDGILTAVKGQLVEQFSPTYLGFPTTVTTWGGEEQLFYNSTQVEKRLENLNALLRSFNNEPGSLQQIGFYTLEELLGLRAAQLLRAFPDFFSPEALGTAPPLYPDRTAIPANLSFRISDAVLNQVDRMMQALKLLFENGNARGGIPLRSIYADLDIFGGVEGQRQGDPGKEDFGNEPTLLRDVANDDVDATRDLIRQIVRTHRKMLGLNSNGARDDQNPGLIQFTESTLIDNHIGYFGGPFTPPGENVINLPGLKDLVPTFRTDSQYFTSLADIFRDFGRQIDRDQARGLEQRRDYFDDNNISLSPYLIGDREAPVGLFADSAEYIRNQVYGHSQRFFSEYLYNKYNNYRADQVKMLQEKTILERLINTNE